MRLSHFPRSPHVWTPFTEWGGKEIEGVLSEGIGPAGVVRVVASAGQHDLVLTFR
jgi:hypothetical protein